MAPRKRTIRTVAAYARRSKERDTLGIDLQLAACHQRAEQEGWGVREFFDDGRSAYAGTRPRAGYEAMLDAIRAGEVEAVVCYKDDRLFRRDRERLRFQDICDAAGVWRIACANGSDFDLTTADGQKAFRDKGSSAEYFSALLSERLRDHHTMLAEQGRDSGGMRPYGFEADRVTIREPEAEMVRDAARRVVAGESLRSICVRWNAEGKATTTGAVWRPTRLRRMLTKPRYAGLRDHHGIVSEAVWPAILDRATFDLVGAVLNDPARRTSETVARRRWLAGFLYCGACGVLLQSHGAGSGNRVYRCMAQGCGAVSVTATPLERYVAEQVWPRDEALHRAEPLVPRPVDTTTVDELAAIETKLRRAGELFAAGDLDDVSFVAASKGLRTQRDALTADQARSPRPSGRTWEKLYTEAMDHAAPWEPGFDAPGDLGSWRAMLAGVVERITVAPAAKRGGRFNPTRVTINWRKA
jgi:site-specific DNA recombinase